MIRSLSDFSRIAREKGPKKLAVLAPEDEEFMRALKRSWQMGYVEPVLIGNAERMGQVADKVEFDISRFEKIIGEDRQAIADLGISLLFTGKLAIASKGQIPTSYIYRSIIREEGKAGSGMTVSVKWKYIEEVGKYLRVILLEDGETIHNAFFDRSYKED
ncbi:MAG: hypothetical protein FJ139_10985 [Deltaproteobacteria bacterium]|nr:hypothetical protein [Deltaproteobacteria bacterium]